MLERRSLATAWRPSVEQRVRALLELILHALHHRGKLFSQRRGEEFFRQVDDVLGDAFTENELGDLIREVVTIVVEDVIG